MEYAIAAMAAILAALIIIIFELKKINSFLTRLPERAWLRPDARDASPTINVNVGSLPNRENQSEPGSNKPPETGMEVDPEPEAEPAIIQKPAWTSLPTRTAASGLGIVKCPHCGSENSSFRNECFSCNKTLA